MIRRFLLSAAVSLCLAAPVRAESEAQTWLQVLSQTKLSPSLRLWGEIQPRYGFDTGNFTTVLVRPALGWQLTPALSFWAGYAWTPLIRPRSRDEHRIWGQGILVVDTLGLALTQRLRLEGRAIEGTSAIAARLRYQARIVVPVAIEGALHLAVYDELFLSLNDAAPVVTSGLDQNRLFLGLYHRFSPRLGLDVGYLWNAVRRAGAAPNRHNHVLMTTLYLSFDLTGAPPAAP